VPVDDFRFPLIHNPTAPDRYWRLEVEGLGKIEGPSVEYHLFRAGTGLDWSEPEFTHAVQRVCTMERALQARHWDRDRRTDEMLLPYFQRTETLQSPFLEERHGLDRKQFEPVLERFYAMHGWDPQTGQPARDSLDALDLGDVYGPMVAGAAKAQGDREALRQGEGG
jgi:aldehyde:ferredoxin oxidoreductase